MPDAISRLPCAPRLGILVSIIHENEDMRISSSFIPAWRESTSFVSFTHTKKLTYPRPTQESATELHFIQSRNWQCKQPYSWAKTRGWAWDGRKYPSIAMLRRSRCTVPLPWLVARLRERASLRIVRQRTAHSARTHARTQPSTPPLEDSNKRAPSCF